MFGFLRSIFSFGGIPSTAKYEKEMYERESKYALFSEVRESEKLKRFLELKEYVNSKDYTNEINGIKKLSFNGSSEDKTLKRFKQIKKVKGVKKYVAGKSDEISKEVEEYLSLQQIVNDPIFENQVKYLKNKNRHKESDAYLCYLEFKQLEKSEELTKYFKYTAELGAVFAEYDRWISKLYDDFSRKNLDKNRWLTKPFWSEQLLNGNPYSPIEELQIPVEENVNVNNNSLKLITCRQEKEGLAWDSKMGFVPKIFKFTSATVNTSGSFRQLYGKFEAKVRVKKKQGVYHSFWMGGDEKTPHINIFKFEGNKLVVSAYNEKDGIKQSVEQVLNYKLNDNYYIYTLLWDKKSLVWCINGKKVFESSSSMINKPLYIAFASGVSEDILLPEEVSMEIEWVRCFRTS